MDVNGEVLAKQAFEAFLEGAGSSGSRWRRGREPPDYYLRVAERRYVVEVTRAMQDTEIGGVKRTEYGWRAALTELTKRVEPAAVSPGLATRRLVSGMPRTGAAASFLHLAVASAGH